MSSRLALAALLVLSAAAAAQRLPGPPPGIAAPPLLLRLEGVLADTPEDARRTGFAVVSLGFVKSDARRYLGVTKARTFGGDQPLNGGDVLDIVAPFTPNFLVTGSDDLVANLRDVPPGTPVRVEGL